MISIKSVIGLIIIHSVVRLCTIGLLVHTIVLLLLSLLHVEEVNVLVFEDLSLLNVPEVWPQNLEGFVGGHGEPLVVV